VVSKEKRRFRELALEPVDEGWIKCGLRATKSLYGATSVAIFTPTLYIIYSSRCLVQGPPTYDRMPVVMQKTVLD